MRIAFTSCVSAELFPQQPVWDQIAAANPDVLVLLGDSVYYDVGTEVNSSAVQGMTDTQFATHAHAKFSSQMAVAEFRSLVQTPALSTYAIWDDHDFLWNDACGANIMKNPALKTLVYPSRAMFAAWRQALAQRLAPGSFPAAPPTWSTKTPAPGYSTVALPENVFLHLTDGRTFRERKFLATKAILGKTQLDEMEAQMKAAPAGAVHLVASGSVFEARHGETWMDCQPEYQRLLTMAEDHNIMVLSGDIHDNNLQALKLPTKPSRKIYEATASGAALYTGVVIGSEQRNYGMLTIDANHVGIEIFKMGALQYPGTISRATWQSAT